MCVYVDLEWGRRHGELAQRYGVKSLPTVVYADRDGEEVGRMTSRDGAAVARDFAALAREHTRVLR